jgi:tetratricopeptide (TPR) repeat protein
MDFLTEHVTKGSRVRMALRWTLGLWLFVVAARSLFQIEEGSYPGIFMTALFAFAKGILGIILIAPELANWLATPLTRMIDSIYLPGGKETCPPLDYRLADYYRTTGQHDEARARYREIVSHYPREGKAYGWLYYLTAYRKMDLRAAGKILRKARRSLRKEAEWEAFKGVVREAVANEGRVVLPPK